MYSELRTFGSVTPLLQAIEQSQGDPTENILKLLHLVRDLSRAEISEDYRTDNNSHHAAHLLDAIANDFLQHSIEDEGISLRDEAPKLAAAFRSFFDTQNPAALYKMLLRVAKTSPIPTTSEFFMDVATGTIFRARVPISEHHKIPVSSELHSLAPVLEESLADPALATHLTQAYVGAIARLATRHAANGLCFIEKTAGPIGAVALLGSLVSQTRLPAVVYRPKYLSPRGQLTGLTSCSPLQSADNVILIYDLFVTGSALQQAATELKSEYGINVIGAVVLFSYPDMANISGNGISFPVVPLASFSNLTRLTPPFDGHSISMLEFSTELVPVKGVRPYVSRSAATVRSPQQREEAVMAESNDGKPEREVSDDTVNFLADLDALSFAAKPFPPEAEALASSGVDEATHAWLESIDRLPVKHHQERRQALWGRSTSAQTPPLDQDPEKMRRIAKALGAAHRR